MPVSHWRVPSVSCRLAIAPRRLAPDKRSVDQPSIRATSRVLLLEGGSLDRVRNWTEDGTMGESDK